MMLGFAIFCGLTFFGYVAAVIVYVRQKAFGMAILSGIAGCAAVFLALIAVSEIAK